MLRNLEFPYRIDGRGTTAEAEYSAHVRQLVELVLFTAPGERVMRPDFGCGLGQLVFEPNSVDLAAATEFLVQSALQQALGDVIEIKALHIEAVDAVLSVQLTYQLRRTGEIETHDIRAGSSA